MRLPVMMNRLGRLLSSDSGEVLTAIALGFTIGTLVLGGAQMTASGLNAADIGRSAQVMEQAAATQRETFEESEELQLRVTDAEKQALYARWEAMQAFSDKNNLDAFIDSLATGGEFIADLGLSTLGPATKGKVLVQTAADVFTAKDPFDVVGAIHEGGPGDPVEMFEYTKEMKERLEGRASAEDFTLPVRKTAAIHKIADMRADIAHTKAVTVDGAAQHVVRERMADAIARSYTELKKSGAIETQDGAYEEFMRRQVLSTHPRETEKAATGDLLADAAAREFFEDGKCDSLLAMINTDQGPVIVELKREAGGKITATSLATKELVVVTLDEGGADTATSEQPAGDWQPGRYKGSLRYFEATIPFSMDVSADGDVTAHAYYDGPTPDWEEHPEADSEVIHLLFDGRAEGQIDEAGNVLVSGALRRQFTHSDVGVLPASEDPWELKGTIEGNHFRGQDLPERASPAYQQRIDAKRVP